MVFIPYGVWLGAETKVESPEPPPVINELSDASLAGSFMLATAKTPQQRVLARLIYTTDVRNVIFAHDGERKYGVYPPNNIICTADVFVASAYGQVSAHRVLSKIPFRRKMMLSNRNDELYPWLQDMADLLAQDCTEVFNATTFSRPLDVAPLEDEHVRWVMAAMQREMDREGRSRSKRPTRYDTLPWERQVALAERRRYRYGQFGIFPNTWASGYFSLWDVSTEEIF